MTDEIHDQLPSSGGGGGAKYAVIGLLMLLAIGGIWYATKPKEPEAPPAAGAQRDAAVVAEAQQQQFDDGFEIPEEEADAGVTITRAPTGPRPAGNGEWSCSGEISVAEVGSAIGSKSSEVRQCYERRLRVDPTISGTLQVRMKVSQSGNVQSVAVGGSIRDPEILGCVRERVRQWHFPNPRGGACAVISAPFQLNPRP